LFKILEDSLKEYFYDLRGKKKKKSRFLKMA